jgi:antitoxin VapB
MSLEIRAPKADALARELATATGEDTDTAVVRAIEERLARTPRCYAAGDAAIEALFERLARMPVLDRRSPDEIIGYGPDGLPH